MHPFSPPSMAEILALKKSMSPLYWTTDPVFLGLDKIPQSRPLLFVGNHTVYGILDAAVMFLELYLREGIFLRSLGDHVHFKIPGWKHALERYGAVDGTRENCAALMQEGACILVYPGGAREVAKRKGEKYKLVWGERTGFARMAMQHGCTIVPFAALGAEDLFEILMDGDELMRHAPLQKLVRGLGIRESVVPPLVRGSGPGFLPQPHRFYFQFGDPVDTSTLRNKFDDEKARWALREEVKSSVESILENLKEYRAEDPGRSLRNRLRTTLRQFAGFRREP